jgi:citrate lyase subunit beta/citryl-CoA lyase
MTRPRRSLLFMPGSNARALEKARTLPVDGIILDLEDSVAPDAKALARDQIAKAITAGGFGKREVLVRINSLDTPWWVDDIGMAGKAQPDGILVPKISSVADLNAVADRLSDINAHTSIRVWAMIETARAVLDADKLALRRKTAKRDCRLCSAPRYFAGDADQDAAGTCGDDPDDHTLHSGDACAWTRDSRRAL